MDSDGIYVASATYLYGAAIAQNSFVQHRPSVLWSTVLVNCGWNAIASNVQVAEETATRD
jgi:hypothetical protein